MVDRSSREHKKCEIINNNDCSMCGEDEPLCGDCGKWLYTGDVIHCTDQGGISHHRCKECTDKLKNSEGGK